MSERKRPLADADPNCESSMPQKSPKEKANASPGSAKTTEGDENAVAEPKFIRLPRPIWDVQKEKWDKRNEPKDGTEKEGEDEDESDDEGDDEQDTFATDSAQDDGLPDWVWYISEEGLAKYTYLEKQAANRDQDEHGLYIYSNFTSYGVSEVVDNWLKDFNKEVSRRKVSPCATWAHLEGLSMFLQLDYVDIWFQGDDCHGFAVTISMVGKALLTGLYLLKNHKLSNPYLPENGGPKNISLVLALFVDFIQSWDDIGGDHYGETAWVSKLEKLAKDNGIVIKGPYKFQERTEDYDDYSVKGWKEEFKAYTKRHAPNGGKTIGGTHYDLTKMSKAEKRGLQGGGGSWGWS
ncbi:uncharacterized protein TRUGW13939_01339 [Talaromyces rugulosus]|uniref:Uncharacterized protein n=1 Tax=Talaromyces rugulosus TaxID=121627 RepID=A0A7H8QK00_TALRU|nr:uncharacterized protein TRUGW13939_01339 [Talaromyces rugulosus]QKX54254.1 hypothetical protein TRUGW13939_01339 [Talaromyces rugulosus]